MGLWQLSFGTLNRRTARYPSQNLLGHTVLLKRKGLPFLCDLSKVIVVMSNSVIFYAHISCRHNHAC